jgi:hypothetical protein
MLALKLKTQTNERVSQFVVRFFSPFFAAHPAGTSESTELAGAASFSNKCCFGYLTDCHRSGGIAEALQQLALLIRQRMQAFLQALSHFFSQQL